jgi:predicted metalloprotease with PDZ domain
MGATGRPAALAGLALALAGAFVGARGAEAQEPAPARPPETAYLVTFEARVVPSERLAHAAIRLGEGALAVRFLEFQIDPDRHIDFRGDGRVIPRGRVVRWEPPARGGVLRYTFRIDNLRTSSAYDARCANDWAVFRGDDLFPPARAVTAVGARSRSTLRLRVPDGWRIAVPFALQADGSYQVDNPVRRFDRPVGWYALGRIGVLRERVAGAHVAVAGPVGQGVRRQDILALMRWTLPRLRSVLGELPERVLVVSAGDPMWRGGLSGPSSVFVHADRPLITPDTTSPLLHELFHAVTRARAGEDGDWVVEGLAEYYSLELLVRSRGVSKRRHARALEAQAREGRRGSLAGQHSSGDATARAVTVLHALDLHIREETGGRMSLDPVVAVLARQVTPVTTASFRATAERVTGLDLESFFRVNVGTVK